MSSIYLALGCSWRLLAAVCHMTAARAPKPKCHLWSPSPISFGVTSQDWETQGTGGSLCCITALFLLQEVMGRDGQSPCTDHSSLPGPALSTTNTMPGWPGKVQPLLSTSQVELLLNSAQPSAKRAAQSKRGSEPTFCSPWACHYQRSKPDVTSLIPPGCLYGPNMGAPCSGSATTISAAFSCSNLPL